MTERDQAIQQIREAIHRLRELGTLDDIPKLVWEEVWMLRGVKRHPETYYYATCDLCETHDFAFRVNLVDYIVPISLEIHRNFRSAPFRERLRHAWEILRRGRYEDEVFLRWHSVQQLRDFLNRIFSWKDQLGGSNHTR